MSSLIVFSIEQYATFTLMNKKVYMDLWNLWRRGGGVASASVAPPLPTGLAFVNDFFYYIGVHADSCRKCMGKSRFSKN